MGPPVKENECFFFLIFFIFFSSIEEVRAQCTSVDIPTPLETLSQYKVGEEGDSYYSHFLVNGDSQYALGDVTASPIYQLTAYALAASTGDCSAACLTNVSAYYRATNDENGDTDNLTIIMLRPSDESFYPDFINTGVPFLCATASGNCGAQTPLYQYYSSQLDDYIADLQKPSNTNATYTISMMGLPLCYLWTPNVTTTTTTTTVATTTTAFNSTTTSVVDDTNNTTNETTNITTTTTPTDIYSNTTTISDLNSTTSTTTPSGNVTTTTATVSNLTTTTTAPNTSNTTVAPGSNSTTTVKPKDKKKGFWHSWKWPIIVVGCLLAIGSVVGIVGCITCCFIGAGAKSAVRPKSASPPPSYDSPYPPELPPQPIDAPSVPPFTVGLPPTVPY